MKGRPGAVLATWLAALLAAPLAAQTPDAEISCRVCHPGPSRGLAASPHGALAARADLAGRVCAACHGDLSGHAAALGARAHAPPPVARVAAASCTACHPGRDLPPAAAAHPVAAVGSGAPPPPPPDAERLQRLQQAEQDPALAWAGFAELGYRFVHHQGSRAGYRTDVDLEPGVGLRSFELRGTGGAEAPLTDLRLSGDDVGDPRWRTGLSFARGDRFAADARYDRTRFRYEATGDFHRVDRRGEDSVTTARLPLGELELSLRLSTFDEDGFWLTQRIGNRNLPVQTFVDGVSSPRSARGHDGELALSGTLAGWQWTLAAGHGDDRSVDRWSYRRPAAANPAFAEAEDLVARSHRAGPTAQLRVQRQLGALQAAFGVAAHDAIRTVAGAGTASGYDTAEFTATTASAGRGRARTVLGDAALRLDLADAWELRAELAWRDHRETQRLRQTDARTQNGTTTVVATDLDDATTQRLFDGTLMLGFAPSDDFDCALGYGHAHEELRVPSLDPPDPLDFRRGHARDDGLLADLRWRLAKTLTLRADATDYAQDGAPLHELVPERARQARAGLDWADGPGRASLWARSRHNRNETSDHRLDAFATGLDVGLAGAAGSLHAGYGFAHTENRTRTTFWFDPDPNPHPALVGFTGDTHTGTLSAIGTPHERLRAEFAGTATRTTGDFDVTTFELRVDLRWRTTGSGAAGCEWRHLRYDDERGGDDWRADLVFVYWRQEW